MGIINMKAYAVILLFFSVAIYSKEEAGTGNAEVTEVVVPDNCPVWECAETTATKCMVFDGNFSKNGQVQTKITEKQSCLLSDVFGRLDTKAAFSTVEKATVAEAEVKKQVQATLCPGLDKALLQAQLQCLLYTDVEQIKEAVQATGFIYLVEETKKTVNATKYLEDQKAAFKLLNPNANGTKKGYVACEKSEECLSNVCGCVVSGDKADNGRCQTAIDDEPTRNLFVTVCEKEWNEADVCSALIQKNQGHQLAALGELKSNSKLPCVLKFADVNSLPELVLDNGSEGSSPVLIIVIVVVVVVLVAVVLFCVCKKKDDGEANKDYSNIDKANAQ